MLWMYRLAFLLSIASILVIVGSRPLPFDITVYDNNGLSLLSLSSSNNVDRTVQNHAIRQCRFRNNHKKECRQIIEDSINNLVQFRPNSVIDSLVSWQHMRDERTMSYSINKGDDIDMTGKEIGVVDVEVIFEGLGIETIQLPAPHCSLDQTELMERATSHCLEGRHVFNQCITQLTEAVNYLWARTQKAQVYGSEVPLAEFIMSDYPNTEGVASVFHLFISQQCIWDVNNKLMEISINRAAQQLVLKHGHVFGVSDGLMGDMSGHWLYEGIREVIAGNLPHNEHGIPTTDSPAYNIKYGCDTQRHHIGCQLPSSSSSGAGCVRFVSTCDPPQPRTMNSSALIKQVEVNTSDSVSVEGLNLDVGYVLSRTESMQRGSTVDSVTCKGSIEEGGLHFIAKLTAPGYRGLDRDAHWLREGRPLIADHEYAMLVRLKQLGHHRCRDCFAQPYVLWGNVSHSHLEHSTCRVSERSAESVAVDSDVTAQWRGYLSGDIGRGRGVSTLGQVARCGWEKELRDAWVTVFRLFDILLLLQVKLASLYVYVCFKHHSLLYSLVF